MSDEQQNAAENSDIGIEESQEEQQPKKGPFLSPLIIRILLIVALLIGVVLISIVVFIVGTNLAKTSATQTRPDRWGNDITRHKVEHLEHIELEEPFRLQLLDGRTIQIKIALGYKGGDKALVQEIGEIKPEIRDIILKHLSHMKSTDFVDESGSSLEKLEEDFLKQINRIINSGKIERILFQDYTLM